MLLFGELLQQVEVWAEEDAPVVVGADEPDGQDGVLQLGPHLQRLHHVSVAAPHQQTDVQILLVRNTNSSIAELLYRRWYVKYYYHACKTYIAILKVGCGHSSQHQVAQTETHLQTNIMIQLPVTFVLPFLSAPSVACCREIAFLFLFCNQICI